MALRATTVFTGSTGTPYLNQFHFPGSGATDAAAAASAASTFWQAISANMANNLSWTRSGEVEEFDPATGLTTAVHSTDPVSGAGVNAAEMLPFTSQALVRWRTGVFQDGREIRGRTFIPGLTQDELADGLLLPAMQTLIANAAGTLADLLGVWSRPREASAGPPVVEARAGQIVPVSASSVWNQFAVLRSRRD
jgi:hypothetical protein